GQRAVAPGAQIVPIDQISPGLRDEYTRSFIFRHFRLYRFVEESIQQRKLGRDYLASIQAGYLGDALETEEWKQAQLNLLRLEEETRRAGALFGLVTFPILFGLTKHH